MLTETLVTALPAGIAAGSEAGELGSAGSDPGGMGARTGRQMVCVIVKQTRSSCPL